MLATLRVRRASTSLYSMRCFVIMVGTFVISCEKCLEVLGVTVILEPNSTVGIAAYELITLFSTLCLVILLLRQRRMVRPHYYLQDCFQL